MKRFFLVTVTGCVLVLCSRQAGASTWYINSAVGASGDGYSWATAFKTIQEGLNALKATNTAEVARGNHVILVTNGTYNESSLLLTPAHNGTNGAPNTIRAVGRVVVVPSYLVGFQVDGNAAGYGDASRATDIVFDGLAVESTTATPPFQLDRCRRIVVKNCRIVGAYSTWPGIQTEHYPDASIDITNCVIYGCPGGGIYLAGGATVRVKNCIVVNNGADGISGVGGNALYITNCCVYGNTLGNIYYLADTGQRYTADSEINNDSRVEGCIARNPGLANGAGNFGAERFEFNAFYAGSPCLNSAEDGGHMGWTQSPTIVPTTPSTYYVSKTGNDGSSGLSWALAWSNITYASTQAKAGATVIVGPGTYVEAVTITNGGSYQLPVTYQASGDVVVTNNSGYPFHLLGVADVTVDGFRVRSTGTIGVYVNFSYTDIFKNLDVQTPSQWGVYVNESARNWFFDCAIHNCVQGVSTYPMYGVGGNVWKRCRIYGNTTYGVEFRSTWNRLENCYIYQNTSHGLYYGNHYSSPGTFLYNCNIYGNGGDGVNQQYHAYAQLYNCTIYGNTGDGVEANCYPVILVNSILAGNGGFGANEGPPYNPGYAAVDILTTNCLFWSNGSASGTTTNNFRNINGPAGVWTTNIYGSAADINNARTTAGGWKCTNNLVADPVFMNAAANDYRLKPGSPCLDAGANVVPTAMIPDQSLDFYGNPRIKGLTVDIGAYEWQPWAGTVVPIK